MSDTEAYKSVFLAESADYLQQITDALLGLEQGVTPGCVEMAFRGAHSLKGMAGAMGYERTATLTHRMESVVALVRDGTLVPDQAMIDVMLEAVDTVRAAIDDESGGGDAVDIAPVAEALERLASHAEAGQEGLSATRTAELPTWRVEVRLCEECALRGVRAHLVIKRLEALGRVIETIPSLKDIEDERFASSFEVALASPSTAEEVRAAAMAVSEVQDASVTEQAPAGPIDRQPAPAPDVGSARSASAGQAQTVRVPITRLDRLVDLVGELVVLRSQLKPFADDASLGLKETVDQLQRISSDLQYEVMRARMVPVGTVFNRFPRMVRDLSRDLGKRARLEMTGMEIELDRGVLDAVSDPLVHLIRNSLDHGIGTPDRRRDVGKTEEGCITLVARRERDHIAISVGDDGKGIDIERVWKRAVELGFASGDSRSSLTANDIVQFIYAPGFSTAEHMSMVSGRGVGMDVVKARIEQLGGEIDVSTSPEGTQFVVRLPQSLAIIQALLVSGAGQLLALPLTSVEEVLSADEVDISWVEGAPLVLLRDGQVVPLRRLDAILFGADPARPPESGTSVVLVQSGGQLKALHVDHLQGRTEIVVKPLSKLLCDTKGLSGAAVMGDGRVLFVIDPRTIFVE